MNWPEQSGAPVTCPAGPSEAGGTEGGVEQDFYLLPPQPGPKARIEWPPEGSLGSGSQQRKGRQAWAVAREGAWPCSLCWVPSAPGFGSSGPRKSLASKPRHPPDSEHLPQCRPFTNRVQPGLSTASPEGQAPEGQHYPQQGFWEEPRCPQGSPAGGVLGGALLPREFPGP